MSWSRIRSRVAASACAAACACLLASGAGAVEVPNLEGFDDVFGRYAPGGDCARTPRIVVDRSGMRFEGLPGGDVKVTSVEYAASFGGNYYEGLTKWFFPFRNGNGYPIVMAFHADEKRGTLAIAPHDEGWQGGPPLAPRDKALVDGSPYALCR